MKILVTGGAGFIGSQLCERLLNDGHKVVCVDDMSAGTIENLMGILTNPNFIFVKQDVNDVNQLTNLLCTNKIEQIYHLAANSSILEGSKDTMVDFDRTFKTTFSVLEAMKRAEVKKLFFSSTSAVYGDKENQPMVESMGELMPENYYGGAKLASEAYISSFAKMNGFDVMIFRFANVIGPHLTHGVIFDFIKKLQKNPTELEILGDGQQTKPYIYSLDLIDAICQKTYQMPNGINVFNCGVESCTSVNEIADIVCQKLGLSDVTYTYTGESIGWKGDVPNYQFDISKLKDTGWVATYTSNEAVEKTVDDWLNKDIVATNMRCEQIVKTIKARSQQQSTNLFLSREYQLQARVEQMLKKNEEAKKLAFEEKNVQEEQVEPTEQQVETQPEQNQTAIPTEECQNIQPQATEQTQEPATESTEQGEQLLFDIFEQTEKADAVEQLVKTADPDQVMANEATKLEEEFIEQISLENQPVENSEETKAEAEEKVEVVEQIYKEEVVEEQKNAEEPQNTETQTDEVQVKAEESNNADASEQSTTVSESADIFEEEEMLKEVTEQKPEQEKTIIVMNDDDTENFVFEFEDEQKDEKKPQNM